ncbi:MAG: hypothetical protein LUG86_01345 [Oscillospiraceae bacterium]|nr:hypothetical protein [Oscillospiraceae bacterium]
MELRYEKAAIVEYIEQLSTVSEQMTRQMDESLNLYNTCRQQYTRISSKLDEVAYRAYSKLEDAESLRRSAEAEYMSAQQMANSSDDEDTVSAARQRMLKAQQSMAIADAEYSEASAAYEKANEDKRNLSQLWEEQSATLDSLANGIQDGFTTYSRVVSSSNDDLEEYMSFMDKSQAALYSGASSAAAVGEHGGSAGSVGAASAESGLSGSQKAQIAVETGWSDTIVNHIDTMDQAEVYKSANLHEAEVNSRACLVKDIDYDYVDEKSGKTNRELMAKGRSPYDSKTGERIELHHMGQKFDGPFVELTENSEHGDGKHSILHLKKENSWRSDDSKVSQYAKQKSEHWKARSEV